MNMTLDEAIKHLNESLADQSHDWGCEECKEEHEQLAEWLEELKELKNSLGAVKLKDMKDAVGLLQELNTENDQLTSQLAEAKRLLKAAVEDLAKIPCNNDVYIPSSCDACIKQGNCDYSDSFKWRYADEALKLIGEDGEQNG